MTEQRTPRVWNYRTLPKHDGKAILPKNAVYVGRAVPRLGLKGSPWGNPFVVRNETEEARHEVIERFRMWAMAKAELDPSWLEPLRGKDLVCWCHPKECHADVLLELANASRPLPRPHKRRGKMQMKVEAT